VPYVSVLHVGTFSTQVSSLTSRSAGPDCGFVDGQQLADRLTSDYPDLKVLFVSGYTDTVVGNRISSSGAVFLQKPFSRETLAKKLREALSKPVTRSVAAAGP